MSLRILLCVDGSSHTDAVIRVGLGLARRHGDATVMALHVVNVVPASGNLLKDLPGRLGFEPAVVSEEIGEEYDEAGRTVLARAKLAGAEVGIDVVTVLDHGAVVECLVKQGAGADLMVLGLAGVTEDRFPGQGRNTADHVVAACPAPVLLTRGGAEALSGVVVGYDGSDAARNTLAVLRALGPTLANPVHAVFVGDEEQAGETLGEVADALPGFVVQTHRVEGESVSACLVARADLLGANTLAIGFSGRSKLHDFFMGRAYERLIGSENVNLLIAP